ncbi:hypothetical protein [Streptomyces sp. NPDC051909]|uniref:hypothetical protein n=1 Tax=Streptomyces sp. NPDC051909 TaxID=3154944 RepID=UPI0034296114
MTLISPSGTLIGGEVLAALSYALFCTSLEPADHPDDNAVRAAVLHTIGSDVNRSCLLQVAQEAGDHPLRYLERISWCRQTVLLTFYRTAMNCVPSARAA